MEVGVVVLVLAPNHSNHTLSILDACCSYCHLPIGYAAPQRALSVKFPRIFLTAESCDNCILGACKQAKRGGMHLEPSHLTSILPPLQLPPRVSLHTCGGEGGGPEKGGWKGGCGAVDW
jgi:hypothetical protein